MPTTKSNAKKYNGETSGSRKKDALKRSPASGKECEFAVIILNTKATPTHHHPISISSPTLNSHCVIALALIITSLFRDHTKLTKRKGRVQWGRGARASTTGRVEGGGVVIGVVLHDEVVRSPVQLIEGLHGLPDNLVDRIDGRRREVNGGCAHFVEILEFHGRRQYFSC